MSSEAILAMIIMIIGFIYLPINGAILMYIYCDKNHLPLLPNEFKKEYKLNWFGSIILFIILLPLAIFVYLYLFIGLIFTSRWPKH